MNGSAQTFRRPSLATTPSQTRESAAPNTSAANNGGVYIPPHLSFTNAPMSRNTAPGDMRYSKDQLLNIFQTLKETSMIDHNLEDIFAGSWNPSDHQNGAGASSAAGDGKDQTPGPEVCWNYNVNPTPFGLAEMTEEEKQVRTILSFSSTLEHN